MGRWRCGGARCSRISPPCVRALLACNEWPARPNVLHPVLRRTGAAVPPGHVVGAAPPRRQPGKPSPPARFVYRDTVTFRRASPTATARCDGFPVVDSLRLEAEAESFYARYPRARRLRRYRFGAERQRVAKRTPSGSLASMVALASVSWRRESGNARTGKPDCVRGAAVRRPGWGLVRRSVSGARSGTLPRGRLD